MIQAIRFINHSGFLLETEQAILIFDYFTDPAEVLADHMDDDRRFVFFVSHAHYDHWNLGIFDFDAKKKPFYILDSSCRETLLEDPELFNEESVIFVEPGSVVELPADLAEQTQLSSIRTFGSTDEGVSFLVKSGDEWIFHAGDLNDWDWQDEDSELMEQTYRAELAKVEATLEEEEAELTAAFIAVDQRLEETAFSGALILLEYLRPQLLIPMHLNGGIDLPEALAADLKAKPSLAGETRVLPFVTSGQATDRDGNWITP